VSVETVNIFANPIAGRGRGKWTAQRLERRLRADGYAVRTALDRPEELTEAWTEGEIRAAVIIGGDGTLRTVASRLLALRGEMPPLLPVPFGTANLMGQHLGIDWNERTLEAGVSDAVRRLHIRTLDAATANGQLFLLMAGVGFDAQVVHELDRIRKGPINMASYVVPAMTAMRDYSFPHLRVIVDDVEIWASRPAIAFVGNVKEYGTGFPVLPFARPDDGVLDVCVMPCSTRFELVKFFLHAAAKQHVRQAETRYVTGKSIRIESQTSAPVQLDGDAGGFTPIDIRLLPVRLPFIVPANAHE
jgi:diacylglycerol kinase family enzyme